MGTLTVEQTLVPGAVIQVYCTGLAPDCVDPAAPQTDAARPVGETVTDADGRFQVHLPDPRSGTSREGAARLTQPGRPVAQARARA